MNYSKMQQEKLIIYDSTLREGAQGVGTFFTVEDKIRIMHMLDDFGVDYIEGGNPGSNPKDTEFYRRAREEKLKHAKLTAFGSTCRLGVKPADDANVQALLAAGTPVVTVFGKVWDFHVTEVLRASLEDNLQIIGDTISYLKSRGKEVVFDAEHFFDGYKNNPEYAMSVLRAANEAGADWLCLCDTNGGCFPHEVAEICQVATKAFVFKVGIHCHNDTGMAAANSLIGVQSGCRQVQMTINGWGERCGNANLCVLIPDLQLKLGYACVPPENMPSITKFALKASEIANLPQDPSTPFVGRNAFAHKAGMHIDAVLKNPASFEHIEPELVGAEREVMVSEVAGRMAILGQLQAIDPSLVKDSPHVQAVLDKLKELEYEGYQFEGAQASFDLVIRRQLGCYKPFFRLKNFKVISDSADMGETSASAVIKVEVGGEEEITTASGKGPVDALDSALRKALERFYPQLKEVHLSDYKVRVLDSFDATASKVRVLIESTDGKKTWQTVGVSADIIEASWEALVDSLEYKLLKEDII